MKVEKIVSEILLNEWDPLSIKDDANAMSEYDVYALRIVGMLYNKLTENQIVEYLMKITDEEFGVPSNRTKAEAVARMLFDLKSKLPPLK